MHRRVPRTNGKAEDDTNAQILSHQESDFSPWRGSRKTPNPFRSPKRNAFHPPLINVVLVCASLCCLLSCLVGFMTLGGVTNIRRNVIPSAPRTIAHYNDEWFLSQKSPPGHKVLHPREQLARASVTSEHIVFNRRTLARVLNGSNEDEYSRQLEPMGREEDESEQLSDDNLDGTDDEFSQKEEEHSDNNPDDNEAELSPEEDDDDDKCTNPDAWENDSHMACNSMHEMDMMPTADSLSFITCGGDRCVFRITDIDGSVFVLKTLKYERALNKHSLEKARMDAFVMTRLTSSPYVMGIYGYCGSSQVVEYGANGNIHDLVKVARETGEDKLSPLDKLRICVQIATAVADMHSLDMVHDDLCCHQFILVDGVYKLSDFDFSEFVKRNKETNETCLDHMFDVNLELMKLRPPEEQAEDKEEILLDRTKVDNYMMGNIMYYLLTTHWLFEGHTRDEAVAKIVHQERSHIPPELLASEDPAIQAIVWAINACWSHSPHQRPPSREISDFLKKELRRIEKVDELGVVRVSVPPLPFGFRHTDSDFVDNLGFPDYHGGEDNDDHSNDDQNNHYYDEDHSNNDYYDEDHSHDDENDAARGADLPVPDTPELDWTQWVMW